MLIGEAIDLLWSTAIHRDAGGLDVCDLRLLRASSTEEGKECEYRVANSMFSDAILARLVLVTSRRSTT